MSAIRTVAEIMGRPKGLRVSVKQLWGLLDDMQFLNRQEELQGGVFHQIVRVLAGEYAYEYNATPSLLAWARGKDGLEYYLVLQQWHEVVRAKEEGDDLIIL